MSELTELLAAGEAAMHEMLGQAFTCERVSGSFTGLLDTASVRSNNGLDGMRAEDMAVLSFLTSSGYDPVVGDVLTVDGREWKVSEVRSGPVKYEVTLISVDE